ncbi:aminopeptidase P family protein [Neobacillus mesonae]|nr:aminopeptidase P family protein [Neobacillus mesonae]
MRDLSKYHYIQSIAKSTITELENEIKEGISEREIVRRAENIMRSKGVERFWYYGIGAFVHVGKRTVISESGKDYKPSDNLVRRDDIVTVDLSPELNNFWGDFARTFIVIDGKVSNETVLENNKTYPALEFLEGMRTEKQLHIIFKEVIKPNMTFEEVFLHMNKVIEGADYLNLDFSGNLGHTIEFDKNKRKYFELGNKVKLSDVSYFTFEPHIKHKNGEYGFKKEDIYYFRNGKLNVL